MSKMLQKLIDRAAAASTEHYRATTALCDYCESKYGSTPGDLDADDIIDAVMGGGGDSPGMSAKDFDHTMRQLTGR